MSELHSAIVNFEESQKDTLLNVVSDKYCRDILMSTMEIPKSAMEISRDRNIPISTVYRRLQVLHDGKLVRVTGTISQDGKKYFLYQSKVKSINSYFDGSKILVEIIPNASSD